MQLVVSFRHRKSAITPRGGRNGDDYRKKLQLNPHRIFYNKRSKAPKQSSPSVGN